MHPRAMIAALRGRLRALFRRGDVEAQLSDDIRFHLEMETEKNVRAGMSPMDARRAAMIAFGGEDRVREAHRDARGTRLIEDALTDFRYGARTLARTPGFVIISVLTLAVAIAIGTSVFTGVNGFFYRSLPVPGGKALLSIFTADFDGSVYGGTSYRDLVTFSERAGSIAELAGEAHISAGVVTGDDVTMLQGAMVSPGYFATLRVTPALGRFPDSARATDPAIVISHALWRRAFGAADSAIGERIKVNGQFFRVAAVTPSSFLGTNREITSAYWIDAAFSPLVVPGNDLLHGRGNRIFHVVARLHDGASVAQLRAMLGAAATDLQREDHQAWTDTSDRVRRVSVLRELDARFVEMPSGALFMIVGGISALGLALLALASTNLASMQMARAAARRREIATRLALGAGRGRLIRQLVAESSVIAIPGALLGLALTFVIARLVDYYRPTGLPNIDMTLDVRSLSYAAGAMLLALLVFGLVPALQSVHGDVQSDLKDAEQLGRRGIRVGGMRGALIIAQVALSVMLTAGSGLVVFALARYASDNRVEGDRVLVASLTPLPTAGDTLRVAALTSEVIRELAAMPGVEAVSAARLVPNLGSRMTTNIALRDGPDRTQSVEINAIRPHYFAIVGVPLLEGRDFDEHDIAGNIRTGIVSKRMAEHLWPGVDPIGRRLHIHDASGDVEIVGVVGELRAELPEAAGAGLLYLPMTPGIGTQLVLHIRVNGPAMATAAAVARTLREHNGQLAASSVMTLGRHMESVKIAERVTARVSAVLALLQLALAIAGLSGLVAYVTAQRRREIGIRTALGANRASIIALVLRQGVRLTMIGGAIGIVLSVAAGQVVAATLPVNAAIELRAVGLAVLAFAIASGVAMLVPARRAVSGTPAEALRVD